MGRTIATKIYKPSAKEMDLRIARFDDLEPISMIADLAWVPLGALEISFTKLCLLAHLGTEDASSGILSVQDC